VLGVLPLGEDLPLLIHLRLRLDEVEGHEALAEDGGVVLVELDGRDRAEVLLLIDELL
jgi:hypothetical protein